MNLMRLGDSLSAVCCNGLRRTGRIIYIHPDGIFVVLEFEGRSGRWREAIMLRRKGLEPEEQPNEGYHGTPRRHFTEREDKFIMQSSGSIAEIAERLGRAEGSVCSRRNKLRRRMQ